VLLSALGRLFPFPRKGALMHNRHHQYDNGRRASHLPEKVHSDLADLPTGDRTNQDKGNILARIARLYQKQQTNVRGAPRRTHEIRQRFIENPSRIGDDRCHHSHDCRGKNLITPDQLPHERSVDSGAGPSKYALGCLWGGARVMEFTPGTVRLVAGGHKP